MEPLSRYEQETVLLFNNADELAEIEAHDARLRKRLHELHEQRPADVHIVKSDKYATFFTFPKSWVRINPPRSLDYTDEQREALRARALLNFSTSTSENKTELEAEGV